MDAARSRHGICTYGAVAIALLAAFALAGLVSAVEPTSLVIRPPRGHFERWAKLSQCGLLRAEGLALGAVRRLGLGRDHFVRSAHGHVLMLGDPVHTDDALIAAVSSWPGALVIVEARDITCRLGRADVIRFAPGRADTIAINPLLGVRGGVHAWSDAMTLARVFLRTTDGMLAASFAALVLDTLAHGLPAARSFAGMRQALSDPQRRLAELCTRWADSASDLGPASGELVRVVRHWRRDGEAALRMLRDIDIALRLFADGDHALATKVIRCTLPTLSAVMVRPRLLSKCPRRLSPSSTPLGLARRNSRLKQPIAARSCGPRSALAGKAPGSRPRGSRRRRNRRPARSCRNDRTRNLLRRRR